jgi:hypothetical protein
MLLQINLESIRMEPPQLHIFIQVETSDLRPVDVPYFRQMGQEFILRRGGGKDHRHSTLLPDNPFHGQGYISGGSFPHLLPVGEKPTSE